MNMLIASHINGLNEVEKENFIEALKEGYTEFLRERLQSVHTEIGKQAERINNVENDTNYLKENMILDSRAKKRLRDKGQFKVISVLGGTNAPAYGYLSKKLFKRFWGDFNKYFGLVSYQDLPTSKLKEADRFVEVWNPRIEDAMLINEYNLQTRLDV